MCHVRVCVFHIDASAARLHPDTVSDRLLHMVSDCAWFQVDFIGGDGNRTAYRYFKQQTIPSYHQGDVVTAFERLVRHVNLRTE
jgi:hypothetical protein